MKILILGAGQVGSSVAANLSREANDITLVDKNPDWLHDLRDRMDIQTVVGDASHPHVLEKAGIEDTDMLIAVTNSDETNMVACQIAYSLYNTPTKIARIRALDYIIHPELFQREAFPIDVIISPEQIMTDYIHHLIEYPGALQVLDFAGGKVQLVGVKAYSDGLLVGHELQTLREHMPGIDTRVAAIYRRGQAIEPTRDTIIEVNDEVFFIAARENIRAVMSELRRVDKPFKRIMIIGGGHIGKRLASTLEKDHQVKIIETNPQRAKYLSHTLDKTVVLLGSATDEELLLEENIESMDAVISCTNSDEVNILSTMLAKHMGAGKVMALINKPGYNELIEQQGLIDVAISPQQVTIGELLTHVRRGDVVAVHSLRKGAAEAIEAVAHGDEATSQVVGKRVDQIDLPHGANIGAIVRGDDVLIAHHDTVIQSEDHVVLFVTEKSKIHEVERLFQVSAFFI